MSEVGALGLDPGGQLVGVVEAQRLVVDPGVEHDVGERAEGVEARAAERGGHEGAMAFGHGAIITQRPGPIPTDRVHCARA